MTWSTVWHAHAPDSHRGRPAAGDAVWALVTGVALVPAAWWVVAALRGGRLGVDAEQVRPGDLILVPAGQTIRFEDCIQGDRYTLRAELPGVDPDDDIEITVANGVLTIHGERREEEREEHRSEFRYGSFTRSVTLPSGADENDVKATYDKGILEISVKISKQERKGRRIAIEKPS